MIQIDDERRAAQAKYEVELALLAGTGWQLLAGEKLIATLMPGAYELSVEWGKLIFAWWDDERAQSWRVTACEVRTAEVRLQATRGLGKEVVEYILRDAERWQPPIPLDLSARRQRYGEWLPQLISTLPGAACVGRVSLRGQRAHGQPGCYARAVLKLRGETVLAVGVNQFEAQAEVDGIVVEGLSWLAEYNAEFTTARTAASRWAQRLWLCVPQGRSQTVSERLALLATSHLNARAECFEFMEEPPGLNAVRPSAQAELLNAHPRELSWPSRVEPRGSWHDRIVALAPSVIEARENAEGLSYSIYGLDFARARGAEREQVRFGVRRQVNRERERMSNQPPLPLLREANFGELRQLVGEILQHRRADAADHRHPFYRWRAEAWLESLLRRDLRQLDPTLDPRFVYAQIPAWRGDARSVIDLLTVNREGRLVVIEIKAAEDSQLPLQGADYWLRIEQSRRRREFERRGLFHGVELADAPPLLYLVAPRLRFHRQFGLVSRCLAPEVEAYRLGVNGSWRAGLSVHAKERVNARVSP